jgi:biopolymer transport protein ExbD
MPHGDLDLLPLMNVFVVLVPMLLASAVFLKVAVIDTNVPSAEAATPSGGENLSLAITIRGNHYLVEGTGLDSRVIPRDGDDATGRLAEALSEVVARHPGGRDVIIISEPKTRYQDIIAVMDISRAAGLPAASLLGTQ